MQDSFRTSTTTLQYSTIHSHSMHCRQLLKMLLAFSSFLLSIHNPGQCIQKSSRVCYQCYDILLLLLMLLSPFFLYVILSFLFSRIVSHTSSHGYGKTYSHVTKNQLLKRYNCVHICCMPFLVAIKWNFRFAYISNIYYTEKVYTNNNFIIHSWRKREKKNAFLKLF